jgi:hypothetical protein
MTPLEILWRSPYPVRARCRRRRFEREGENSLYVLQEFRVRIPRSLGNDIQFGGCGGGRVV